MIAPNPSRVWGVDVSHWNSPPIDFDLLKLQGCKFVIIKACDGAVKTRYFEDHYQGAVKAGLVVMMYVWLYPANRVSIDSQANRWAEVYKSHPEIKSVWVDAEKTKVNGEPANPNASDLTAAQNKLKAQIGNRTGDYTSPGYAREFLKGYVYNNPLWVANYDVLTPTLPAGASTWEFWQFADNLRSSVGYDTNYYNGTLEQFVAKYGGTVEIPPPTGDKMKYDAKAIDNSTKTRPNHNTVTDFTPSRYHNAGTVFSGDELWVADNVNKDVSQNVGDKWLKVKEINGLAVSDCWVAVIHKGVAICGLVENVVTPPPPSGDIDVHVVVSNDVVTVTVNGQEWKKV